MAEQVCWRRVTVTAEQPLAVGNRPETGQVRDSYSLIPGWVLRGALAARWIRHNGLPSPAEPTRYAEFDQLFESGQVRFGPLHLEGHAPLWTSLLSHKYGRHDCPGEDVDTATLPVGAKALTHCPRCGDRLEAGKGGIGSRTSAESVRADRIHAELDPDDRPVDGKLFIRRRINKNTVLSGLMACRPEAEAAVCGLLDDDAPLLIGGNRTASGRVGLAHTSVEAPQTSQVDATRVILRLYSPAIFVDEYGRPATQPDEVQLERLLGVPATVEAAWTRTETVGGWHAASGMPKPVERAVVAGSVFAVRCEREPTTSALSATAYEGLGLRRHEGFGWVATA